MKCSKHSQSSLTLRSYSTALSMSKAQISVLKDDICFDDITGFVTCRYDGQGWLGCVLDTSADTEEVTISFFHPCRPAPSLIYPRNPDVLVTHCISICINIHTLQTFTSLGDYLYVGSWSSKYICHCYNMV